MMINSEIFAYVSLSIYACYIRSTFTHNFAENKTENSVPAFFFNIRKNSCVRER